MTDEDTYPNAGRDSGYTDEEGKPVGENIINRVTELLLPLDVKLTLMGARLDSQFKGLRDDGEHRQSYLLQQIGSLIKDVDARLDHYGKEIDATLTAVQGVAASVGKQEERIDTLSERMAEVESAIAARPEARAAEHRAIVEEIGGKLDTFGQEFAEFKVAFAVFNASLLLSENAVVVINLSQVIVRANRKALEYFGYTAEELIGQPLDILIPERFRDVHRAHIEAFAQSSETQQLMADRRMVYGLHKDGSEFPIKAAISKVPDGYTAVVRRVNDGAQ